MSKWMKSTPPIASAGHPVRCSRAPSPLGGVALRQRKYRELARKHLDKLLERLFADFTGVHFHITWAHASSHQRKPNGVPPPGCTCCRVKGQRLRPSCQSCGPKRLHHTERAEHGHRFTCHLGIRNYWLALRLRGETVGIACLQALDEHHGKVIRPSYSTRNDLGTLSGFAFIRATKLLRFVVEYVQAASLADLRKSDLMNAGNAVIALEKEQARLHQALQRHLAATHQVPCHPCRESHPEQIVHRLVECIERDYGQALTLRNCAAELGMNAAYLSALFSRIIGVPFKSQLTEFRMTRAKELLNDPAKNVSEVAGAVGYASENRFRIAFKKATGLSPKFWRETMQTHPTA